MKIRELILWILVIALIAMAVLHNMQINSQYEIIKTMHETQKLILELLDLKYGWLLL